MNWTSLDDLALLEEVDRLSAEKPVLIFKHSTRCSISSAALERLEREWTKADDERHTAFFLDLLLFRPISNAIAERYGVRHGSPQALVISNGTCIHDAAHFGITYKGLLAELGA